MSDKHHCPKCGLLRLPLSPDPTITWNYWYHYKCANGHVWINEPDRKVST